MEAFYTLQGEGMHAGKAAFFIRLAGCDVGCVWCDVKDSWNADKHPLVSVDDLVVQALQYPSKNVVITGGEPAMYNLDALTQKLKDNGFQTHIETSGAYPLTGTWDWICVSPKKFKAPLKEALQKANELKIIIFNKSDFDWAEQHAKTVTENCALLLQPEWDKRDSMSALIVEYVKSNPKWRASLQTHKYLNIP